MATREPGRFGDSAPSLTDFQVDGHVEFLERRETGGQPAERRDGAVVEMAGGPEPTASATATPSATGLPANGATTRQRIGPIATSLPPA
jgi:hypothetical protein